MAKKKDENLTPEERAYQAALAKHIQELRKINKETERQKSFWDSIVFAITDVSESNFFVNIKRSPQDIARANARLEEMNVILKEVGENVNNSFEAALSTVGDISTAINTDLKQDLTRLAGINAEMATDLTEALYQGDITKFFAKFGDEGRKAFNNIVKDKKGFEAIHQFLHEDAVKDFGKINDQVKKLIILSQEQEERLFSWRKTLSYIGENIFRNFTPKNLLSIWNDFDQIINETQRNFGIAMDANAGKFTTLVTQNQIFGMGAKENAALMGQLGDELRSTNFDMLSKAALDMGAIQRATGLSVEEVGELGKQMMFFGRSSETVRDFTEETMQMALKYGLSSKKVLQEVTKALPDARKLGWAGGEKALRDMVLQSQKLGQTLEGLAAAAKKLRTLEGSLEAAADLALVGVNVNAIQMLGAARRGGKEFSSFISDITKSIGTIKDTGEVDFSPIDIDRLQVIADATGSTIEDLQNQIAKGAQRNRKLELLPPSLMGANLSDEEREFLLNAAQIGKNGKALDLNLGGIKDITKLTPELLRSNMAQKLTLEEAAKNNQSFNESLTNFSNTVKALFTYVQPIIEEATRWIQGLNNWVKELPESAKKMVGILAIGMGIFFVAAKHFFSGYWYGQGFNSAVNKGGFLSGFGKLLSKFNPANWMKSATAAAAPTAGPNLPTNYQPPSQGAIQNTSSFGEALKNFPKPGQLLALSVAIVAVGAAFVGIGYGIKLAAEGLATLVTAFDGISNAGAALGAVSVVMAGFVGMLAIMIPIIGALGTAGNFGAVGLLAIGAAFVGIGFGVKLASDGIANLVKSFDGLSNSVSAVVAVGLLMGGFVGILYAMSPAIVALGAALATLGATGAISLPVLAGLALVGTSVGLAFLGIGYGIKMASEGLAVLVKSFDGVSASISSVVSVGLMMGGVVAIMYAMTPAILALGGSLFMLGASGVVALPMMLALSGAMVAFGFGIKIASAGVIPLVNAFKDMSSSVGALVSIGLVLGGMVASIYALSPAILALGGALAVMGAGGLIAVPVMAAIAGAMVGLSYGIKVISAGLVPLVSSFDGLSNSLSAISSIAITMGGFVALLYALSPAILALSGALVSIGASGLVAIPVMGAITIAMLGVGYGIKAASEGLSNLVTSFKGLSDSVSAVAAVGLTLGGFVVLLYAMSPAIVSFSVAMSTLGVTGLAAIPVLISMGAAMIGMGIGIKFASEGIAKLATTFSGLSSSVATVASVGLSLATFVGVLYAMVPAISSLGIALAGLGLSGMVALPVMAGLGLAMAGIGYGFKLASEGIATIIKSLASVQTSITPLSTMVPTLAAMTGILFALSPGLLLLGGSLGVVAVASALAIPGVIALGAAIIGIGAGINLASKGISELVSSFAQLNNSVGAIATVGLTMAGFVAVLYASTPAIAALGVALAGLGVSGWVAIPTLLALGGAATLVGLGIKLAAEGIGFAVKSFKDLSSSIEKTTSSSPQLGTLSTSLAKFTPTVAGFGASGLASGPGIIAMAIAFGILAPAVSLLAPALEKISTLNLGNLSNIGDSLGSLAKGAIGIGAIGAMLPLLASAALGLTLIKKPFENIIPVFNQLGTVDWSKIQSMGSALLSMIPGIFAFSALGLVSPLLTATSGGLLILGKALTYFSALNLSNLASLGDSLSQSISGIMKFAAVGLVSPALILASMALSNIGNALSSVKEFNMNALSNIGEVLESLVMPLIKFSTIGLFAGPIALASGVMLALGGSLNYFSSRIGDIANVNWSGLDQFSDSMSNMIPGLLKFAGLGLLMVPISAGIAMLGILGSTLPKFAQGLQILNTVDTSGLQSLSSKLLTFLPGLAGLSLLGIVATPFAIGATVLAGGAKMLESASVGINKFLSIPWENFTNMEGPISQLTGSLLKFAVLSIIGVPILAGATMLAGAGFMLGEAAKGFDKLSLVNWTGLGQMGSALNAMLPSFLKFSLIGLMSGPLIAGATAVSLAGSLLGKSVDGFVKFGKVNFNAITNFGEIIPELMSSLGKLSLLSILAVPVIIGAEMLAIAGSAFGSAAKGFNQLSSVDWNSLQGVGENLTGLLGGLMKLAGVGIVAPLIVAAGLALSGIGLGLKTFSSLKLDGIENLGGLIENLVPGLIKFSIVGALMAPITLAAGAISILGGAFVSLSSGAKYLEKIDWSVLNSASDSLSSAIPAFLQLAGVGMVSLLVAAGAGVFMLVGKSLSSTADGFKSLSDVNWSVLSKVGNTVDSMVPGFSKMGMISMQVSPAISSLSSVMSELAEVMESMSSPIDMAAKSLNDMASNTERLKSSVQSIDTSRLTALTGYSDKMVNNQVGRSEVIAVNEPTEKQQHVTFDPIVIKLQMPNGREIQEIIVKDTGHSV